LAGKVQIRVRRDVRIIYGAQSDERLVGVAKGAGQLGVFAGEGIDVDGLAAGHSVGELVYEVGQ
jgi:hypothetical protein